MANYQSIGEERFRQLAQEVGVPLEIAGAFWGIESGFGTNAMAFSPNRVGSNSYGAGDMQVIKKTYEMLNPGKRQEDATSEDLARTGLQYLKSMERPDGTYDIQDLKSRFFGRGADRAFKKVYESEGSDKLIRVAASDPRPKVEDYYPSKDPEIHAKLTGYIDGIKTFGDSLSIAEAAAKGKPSDLIEDSTKSSADSSRDITSALNSLPTFNAEEATRQYQESIEKHSQTIGTAAQGQEELAGQIMDLFQMNPSGASAALQKTATALTREQGRLQDMVGHLNFEGDYGSGPGGFLKAFIYNLGSKLQVDRQAKLVETLNKSASDLNQIVSQIQEQAAKTRPTPAGERDKLTAARLAAQTEAGFLSKEIQSQVQAAGLSLREQAEENRRQKAIRDAEFKERDLARKEEEHQLKVRRTEVQIEEGRQRAATALQRNEAAALRNEIAKIKSNRDNLLFLYGKDNIQGNPAMREAAAKHLGVVDSEIADLEAAAALQDKGLPSDVGIINKAVYAAAKHFDEGAEPPQFSERAAAEKFLTNVSKANKPLFTQILANMALGENAKTGSIGENLDRIIFRGGTAFETRRATDLKNNFEAAVTRRLNTIANSLKEGTNWETFKLNSMAGKGMNPKSLQEITKIENEARAWAEKQFDRQFTPENDFHGNVFNRDKSMGEYLNESIPGEFKEFLTRSGMDISSIKNDNDFFGRLIGLYQEFTGGMIDDGRAMETFTNQIVETYKNLAEARAGQPIYAEAGIKLDPSIYVVNFGRGNGQNVNLASPGGVHIFMDYHKGVKRR